MRFVVPSYILMLVLFAAMFGCGKNKDGSSAADVLPEGTDISVSPAAGENFNGGFIFSARGSKDSTLYYSLRPFTVVEDALSYAGPMVFQAPVVVYMRSQVDGKLGPQKEYSFSNKSNSGNVVASGFAGRLRNSSSLTPLGSVSGTSFAPDTSNPPKMPKIAIDGDLKEWNDKQRLVIQDAAGDVPAALNATDITAVYVAEDSKYFYIATKFVAKPTPDDETAYGLDIGVSNITFDNFGPGVDFLYRVEIRGDRADLYDRSEVEKEPKKIKFDARLIESAMNSGLEIRIDKTLFPKLKNEKNLAIQGLAGGLVGKKYVVDYSPTLYVRSEFELERLRVDLRDKRQANIEFFVPPKFSVLSEIDGLLGMAKIFLRDLEIFQKVNFYEQGSIPLFYATSDENGFSGLNASDRGVLTTRVVAASPIEKAHILLHEFAHFQNAISSKINLLWLREGYSDWVSENMLYQYFPAQAVYDYMRKIRYENYFTYNAKKRDAFALAEWEIDSANPGYEKSLMAMNVIASAAGQDALLDALQAGINFKLDNTSFQKYLEFKSGENLSEIFDTWVLKAQDDQYAEAFRDDDGDGLMNFDEVRLGTNPKLIDSDADGYLDSEEAFRGRRGDYSQVDFASVPDKQRVVLVDKDAKVPVTLMRLGANDQNDIRFSLGGASSDYHHPLFLRAPYSLTIDGQSEVLERPLYDLSGNIVPVSYQTSGILPLVAQNNKNFVSGLVVNPDSVQDFTGDVPADYAGYDITDLKVSSTNSKTTFEIFTKGKPDFSGAYGKIEVELRSANWTPYTIDDYLNYTLRIENGILRVIRYINNVPVAADDYPFETQLQYLDNKIRVTVNTDLIPNWTGGSQEKQVCAVASINAHKFLAIRDEVSCMVVTASDFTASSVSVPGPFGEQPYILDLHTKGESVSSTTRAHLQNLGGSAIHWFARFLGQPLYDRHHWPLHYEETSISQPYVAFRPNFGAYVGVPTNFQTNYRDFLVVLQLARVYVSSLSMNLTANNADSFQAKEILAHWLTLSALNKILPTADALNIYHNWSDDYIRFKSINHAIKLLTGSNAYSSTGVGAFQTFVSYLDTKLGTAAMSKIMSLFVNRYPRLSELHQLLLDAAPDQAATIEQIWTIWVEGTAGLPATEFNSYLGNSRLFNYEAQYLNNQGADALNYSK